MKTAPLIISALAVVCIGGSMVEWSRRTAISDYVEDYRSYETRDGKIEAESDLAKGEPKWKVYGLYRNYDEDSARLKRLGIKIDWFADCIISEPIARYRFRYNSAVYSHYVNLVGREITEEVLGDPPINHLDLNEEG